MLLQVSLALVLLTWGGCSGDDGKKSHKSEGEGEGEGGTVDAGLPDQGEPDGQDTGGIEDTGPVDTGVTPTPDVETSCTGNAECPDFQFCLEGRCRPGNACNRFAPCPRDAVCDPLLHRCVPVECREGTDCPDVQTCREGLCFGPERSCAAAETLKAGELVQGTLVLGATNFSATCLDTSPSRETIYRFTLEEEQDALISVDTQGFIPVVYLRSDCDAESADLICEAPKSNTVSARVYAPRLAAGDYFVYLDSTARQNPNNAFTIKLDLFPPSMAGGPSCEEPAVLTIPGERGEVSIMGVTSGSEEDAAANNCGSPGTAAYYKLDLQAAAKVSVTLQSPFERASAELVLDTCGEVAGRLACIRPNTQKVLRNAEPGSYYIVVAGPSAGYVLTIKLEDPLPPPANDSCDSPEDVVLVPGQPASVEIDTSQSEHDYQGACTAADAPDVVYRLLVPEAPELGSAFRLTATLRSSADPTAGIVLRASCGQGALGCARANAPIVLDRIVQAGEYFLIVDGHGDQAVDLMLEEYLLPVVVESCEEYGEIIFLDGEARIQGDLVDAERDVNDWACWCTPWAGCNEGPDHVWHFHLDSPKVVTARFEGDQGQVIAHLRNSSCNDDSAQAGCMNSWDMQELTQLMPVGDHFVVIRSSYFDTPARYEIVVTAVDPPPPPANDTCDAPEELVASQEQTWLHVDLNWAFDSGRGGCSNMGQPDVVYRLVVEQDSLLSMGMNYGDFEPIVYLRRACDSENMQDEQFCTWVYPWQTTNLNVPAGDYFLWVETPGNRGAIDMWITVTPPPPNDTCEGAEELTLDDNGQAWFHVDLRAAWDSGGGTCGGWGNMDSVYRVVLEQESNVQFTVSCCAFSPIVYMRRVCDSGSWEDELGCTWVYDWQPGILQNVPAGEYYVWVENTSGPGEVDMSITVAPPPPNDSCAQPEELEVPEGGGQVSVHADLAFATDSGGSDGCGAWGWPDLVYHFTLNDAANLYFEHRGGNANPVIYLRRVCDASWEEQGCLQIYPWQSGRMRNVPPGEYWLWVDGDQARPVDFMMDVQELPPPEPGESCELPFELGIGGPDGGTMRVEGDFNDSTPDLGDWWCGSAQSGDRVYMLQLEQTSEVRWIGEASEGMHVQLRTECHLADDQDWGWLPCWNFWGRGESTFTALPAGTYYFVVRANDPNQWNGSFSLEVRVRPMPVWVENDVCEEAPALSIVGNRATALGNTLGAGDERSLECSMPGGPDVFYTLELERRSRVTLDLRTYDFGGTPALLSSCDPEAEPIICGWDSAMVDAGLYYVMVEGMNPLNSGDFRINVLVDPLRLEGEACDPERRDCDTGLFCGGDGTCQPLGFSGAHLWAVRSDNSGIDRIDLETGEVVETIESPGYLWSGRHCGLALDDQNRLYMFVPEEGLWRRDPSDGNGWQGHGWFEWWFSQEVRGLSFTDGQLLIATSDRVQYWDVNGQFATRDLWVPWTIMGGAELFDDLLYYTSWGVEGANRSISVVDQGGGGVDQWPMWEFNETYGTALVGDKLLVSEMWDNRVHVIDLATGQKIYELMLPQAPACGLAVQWEL